LLQRKKDEQTQYWSIMQKAICLNHSIPIIKMLWKWWVDSRFESGWESSFKKELDWNLVYSYSLRWHWHCLVFIRSFIFRVGMPDVYPPAEASKFCYTGLMRSAQFAHDWSRCDNQAFEAYL
jgi:hypothetical protein